MPQFETYQSGDNAELTLKPSKGDVRLQNGSILEAADGYGGWTYIGDMITLFRAATELRDDVDALETWMQDEEAKHNDAERNIQLEEQFEELARTGEFMVEIESVAKEARQQLLDLEESVSKARRAYVAMKSETQKKLQTFKELEKPYPDSDANKTGYSI